MIPRTRKYLNARASIGRDLWMEGKISLAERLRLSHDASSGIDTGDIKYLPRSEWAAAKLAAQAFMDERNVAK